MQLQLRTIGFRDGHSKRLPYFEHAHWFFWTKFHTRMDPTVRDRGFESAFAVMAAEARAAPFNWWCSGKSRHVMRITISMAEAQQLPVPWKSEADARAFVVAFCTRAGLRLDQNWGGEPVEVEDARGLYPCHASFCSDANGVELRLWTRSGPRLARLIGILSSALVGESPHASHSVTSTESPAREKTRLAA